LINVLWELLTSLIKIFIVCQKTGNEKGRSENDLATLLLNFCVLSTEDKIAISGCWDSLYMGLPSNFDMLCEGELCDLVPLKECLVGKVCLHNFPVEGNNVKAANRIILVCLCPTSANP
jgi:hypothetical protein